MRQRHTTGPNVIRMLTLIPWLLQRPGISVADTAGAFAVDEGTLRRELEHLDYCGLPGLGGGALFDVSIVGDSIHVRMADELRRPLRPTPVEALRLLLMATAVERTVGSEVPALRSAIGKLHDAFGTSPASIDVLDVGPVEAVQEARRAIAADRSVRFSYRGRADSAPMDRHVDPWALDLVDGAWYLHGADRGLDAPRIFRLDRSSGLTLADEPRVTPAPVDLPVPRYEPAPDDLEVELRLEQGAAWLLDALTVDATLESDRQLVVRLRTGDPEWLARLVLMAGGGAEVIAPDMLRRIVRDRARRALGLAAAAETMRD